MMHVVVTGAAGFIGSHTCERLVACGHRVTGVDSFDSYLYPATVKRTNAADLARLPSDRFRLIEGDICDPATIAAALSEDIDVVCHLAALAGVRPSLAEPLRYVQTNIAGTAQLLEHMRKLRLQRLVFASSSSVYGAKPGTEVAAFREDDPCLTPASPYAATKRMNELQLSTYRDLFGIGVFALRYFTVYGPRQRPDMAIHRFTRAIARGETITQFGDGSSRRDYTYIEDIVSGTVAAVERVTPGRYEIFNLGGTATISLRELIELIERTVGRRAVVDGQPDQPGDVPLTYANIDRARSALEYAPTTPITDGIPKFWRWLQPRL
jgi:UDP-glucuronate 4-epimerase